MTIHFLEIRRRIIYIIYFYINIFIILFYYSDIIYDLFSLPIKKQLPIGATIIATNVTSTFLVPLKLSINLSFIIILPYLILHFWYFISPGLYKNEKNAAKPFMFCSLLLFIIGLCFAFYVIAPLALNFFMTCAPSNVSVMISINNYMDFMFNLMLGSGIAFQIPLAIIFLTKIGLISKDELANKRSYIIVFAFILGMLLTPPDVVSQILLAIPIWLLFELGMFFSK